MVVVVDSGSTKADWKMVNSNGMQSISTMGFNPVFHTENKIYQELQEVFDDGVKPEEAEAEHRKLLGWEREMLAAIDVPYRVIDVAGGDLGSSASRKFDCEAWVPTQNTYRELTSTSNCTTFQARRLSIRYRDDNGKPQVAATLNGTLATTRWLVAILENHQQPDGSVVLPPELARFVGTEVLEPK